VIDRGKRFRQDGAMGRPELSVIVPILNEAAVLPELGAMLSRQEEVSLELVLSDGGSQDRGPESVKAMSKKWPFPVRVVSGPAGRGRQLNAGAQRASAEFLLFLHADSNFHEPLAFRRALDQLQTCLRQRGDGRVAGHFALRFDRGKALDRSLGYTYYEVKARMDRAECTHGDQGFLLPRGFFQQAGPFDESLPILEDTRLAEKIRGMGEWVLLPAEILTSARRFETEGLYERQLLNALIMNFAAQGWDDFFASAKGIYRQQCRTERLQLYPFLRLIRSLEQNMSGTEWWKRWYRTGAYVRSNAWQVALAHDVRRQFRQGIPAAEMTHPGLTVFDRWWDPLTDHPTGRFAAMVLTWLWFRWTCRKRAKIESPSVHSAHSEES